MPTPSSPLVHTTIVIDEHSSSSESSESSDSDDGYLEDEELDADDVEFISASDFLPSAAAAAAASSAAVLSQRVRRQLVCAGCSFLALALLLAGLLEIVAAEDEARHGWRRSLCRIVHPDNNTSAVGEAEGQCMFVPVVPVLAQIIEPNGTTLDAPTKCGVPASITSVPSLAAGELACDADAADVAYWRARPHHANVECRVPVRLQYALDASVCAAPPLAHAAAPHERLASYFLWTAPERFVYLERTRAEGDRALRALAAARQTHACVQVALGGAALCALALAAYCWCPPATCTRRKIVSVFERRGARRAPGAARGRKDRGKIP